MQSIFLTVPLYLIARQVEYRSYNDPVRPDKINTGKALQSSPAHDAHHHSFGLVVSVMCDSYPCRALPAAYIFKRPVAQPAPDFLSTFARFCCYLIYIVFKRYKISAKRLSQCPRRLLVTVAFLASKPMIYMDGRYIPYLKFFPERAQRMKKTHRIRPAGKPHNDPVTRLYHVMFFYSILYFFQNILFHKYIDP